MLIIVVINSSGRLGIAPVVSSERFKRDIQDMGGASGGLMKLRPVTFRYKQDPDAVKQYGLIAEEVELVYPELVTHGRDGRVETVRYMELVSMLLNEVKKQALENQQQSAQIRKLTVRLEQEAEQSRRLSAQVAKLNGVFERAKAATKHNRQHGNGLQQVSRAAGSHA